MTGGFEEIFAAVFGQSNRVLLFNKKVSLGILFIMLSISISGRNKYLQWMYFDGANLLEGDCSPFHGCQLQCSHSIQNLFQKLFPNQSLRHKHHESFVNYFILMYNNSNNDSLHLSLSHCLLLKLKSFLKVIVIFLCSSWLYIHREIFIEFFFFFCLFFCFTSFNFFVQV